MLLHTLLAALAAISISVQGHYFIAPQMKLRVTLTIPANPDNRMAIVEWEGEGEGANEGQTSRQLDEYVDWQTHPFYILLTPGKYTIRGRLIQRDGKQTVTRTETVEIIESLPPER